MSPTLALQRPVVTGEVKGLKPKFKLISGPKGQLQGQRDGAPTAEPGDPATVGLGHTAWFLCSRPLGFSMTISCLPLPCNHNLLQLAWLTLLPVMSDFMSGF